MKRTTRRIAAFFLILVAAGLAGCATAARPADADAAAPAATSPREVTLPWRDDAAWRSTYEPLPSAPVLITNATILTAAGERIPGGTVLLRGGVVEAVGAGAIDAPPGATVIDGTGKWVTPGVIDAHSHLGVYPSPGVAGLANGNEMTDPNTAEVWAEHAVWPQDPQFPLALAGGVTTIQILPGSANLFGGRGVTVRNVPARDVYAMKFPGAPQGLKMACGENPMRLYGSRNRAPSTRMGNVAGYRAAWIRADEYRREWTEYAAKVARGEEAKRPHRDLELDTLAGVLEGDLLAQIHCYRADEMTTMIDVANEFGYRVAAFHHAVEAYKIADRLAENHICADVWADWWGFKMEAFDAIRENAALVDAAGGCAVIHSDDAEGIQRLNQEAAKAMAAGTRIGIPLTEEDAIRWITINPARSLGIAERTGSLEPGKAADVVLWSGNPFSVYSRPEKVFIDGALVFDLSDPSRIPRTDFSVGLTPEVTR